MDGFLHCLVERGDNPVEAVGMWLPRVVAVVVEELGGERQTDEDAVFARVVDVKSAEGTRQLAVGPEARVPVGHEQPTRALYRRVDEADPPGPYGVEPRFDLGLVGLRLAALPEQSDEEGVTFPLRVHA